MYKRRYVFRFVSIILIQVFLVAQINVSGVISSYDDSVYKFRGLRRRRDINPEIAEESLNPLESFSDEDTLKYDIAVRITNIFGGNYLAHDISSDNEYILDLTDSLIELQQIFQIGGDELIDRTNVVLNNIDSIIPQADEIHIGTMPYILPWLRVAVEIGIREGLSEPEAIGNYLQDLISSSRNTVLRSDVEALLGESLDLKKASHVSELAEYTRINIIHQKIKDILVDKFDNLDSERVEKYQGLLGAVVQIGNLMHISEEEILSKVEDLISGIFSIESAVAELTDNRNPEYVIPWLSVGLLEGIHNDYEGEEIVNHVVELIRLSKDNVELQIKAASALGLKNAVYTDQDYIFNLALNAGVEKSRLEITNLLDSSEIGTVEQREVLSEYLVAVKQMFGLENIGSVQELVNKTEESFDRVEGLLGEISKFSGKEISISDNEVLPWVWLSLVLDLDMENSTTVGQLLSFAEEENLKEITSYILGTDFNPEDILHIASLIPSMELLDRNLAGNFLPVSQEELEIVVEDTEVEDLIANALSQIGETDIESGDLSLENVKKALVFEILVNEASVLKLIKDLTGSELNMARELKDIMSEQDIEIISKTATEIVRQNRRDNIDGDFPDALEPSGFDWRSSLFNMASMGLSALIAAGVFMGGDPQYSSALFRSSLAFLTYANVKPIVDLGLVGLKDMIVPPKIAPEVESIMENGVPDNHRGMILRQMYVIKDKQLNEELLLGEWLKQRKAEIEDRGDNNILLGLLIDVDSEEYKQKVIQAYEDIIEEHPEYEDEVFLFVRYKDEEVWGFQQGYGRKEGRIDDLLAFLYKGINYPEGHIEGPRADLRQRDRNGNIKILGGNFYIDGKTDELRDKEGNGVFDEDGNIITEDRVGFENVYEVKDGKLYDGYGSLIAKENEFIVNKAEGIVEFVKTPYRTDKKEFRFIIEEGELYDGVQKITDSTEFIGDEGKIMIDVKTGEIIKLVDGRFIRGNYIGLDLRRNPFSPLFTEIRGDVESLHIGDEEGVKYVFAIDEDTEVTEGSIRKMIAKFAHPENEQYVAMQPSLKNTNAYQSLFTRSDTWAKEILRYCEFGNWDIFGGIMYGKWGARVKEYYEQIVEKDVVYATARSEDERPTIYVPVLGVQDIRWGDEPKGTFFRFMARMREWTIGDMQTLQKEYLPRMLGGVPYKIYSAIKGKEVEDLPKLSPQGKNLISKLAQSMYMPATFTALIGSYLLAGNVPGLYMITSRSISNLITAGVVAGGIFGVGKWIAPTVRDLRTQESLTPRGAFNIVKEDTARAFKEFFVSTGLYIPFTWLKNVINLWAYKQIKKADKEAGMVPRTPGVLIRELGKIESVQESYRKLITSPLIGLAVMANLAFINPKALIGFIPLAYSFLFQPYIAYLAESTTDNLSKAIGNVDEKENGKNTLIGEAFTDVYEAAAEETMADERLNRIFELGNKRLSVSKFRFGRIHDYLVKDLNERLEVILKRSIWNKLNNEEKTRILEDFNNEDNAKEAVFEYLQSIYQEEARITEEEFQEKQEEAEAIQNFKLKSKVLEYMDLNEYPEEIDINDLSDYLEKTETNDFNESDVKSVINELIISGIIPEYFEIVDEHTAQSTGMLKQRESVHNDGDWHLAVSILVLDKEGNILLHKRGPTVAEPDRWEVSASGHVRPGETAREAVLREMEEEIGLRIEDDDSLVSLGEEYQFIKIGKDTVEGYNFEGDRFIHHSEDPANNQERLSLFMYIVSDEEEKAIEKYASGELNEEVSEMGFLDLEDELEKFRDTPMVYSSAFAFYLSQDEILEEVYKNLP